MHPFESLEPLNPLQPQRREEVQTVGSLFEASLIAREQEFIPAVQQAENAQRNLDLLEWLEKQANETA